VNVSGNEDTSIYFECFPGSSQDHVSRVRWPDEKPDEGAAHPANQIAENPCDRAKRGNPAEKQKPKDPNRHSKCAWMTHPRPGSFSCPLSRRSYSSSPSARPPELSDGVNGLYTRWFCALQSSDIDGYSRRTEDGGRRAGETEWGYEGVRLLFVSDNDVVFPARVLESLISTKGQVFFSSYRGRATSVFYVF
jgi:hypothetical protein